MNIYHYINLDYINRVSDGDKDFEISVLILSKINIRIYINDLKKAVAELAIKDINFLANKLSATYTIIGAETLNKIAFNIETNILNGMSPDELNNDIKNMEQLSALVVEELNQELKKISPLSQYE